MGHCLLIINAAVCFMAFSSIAHADESMAGIACRSVHLNYQAGEGTAFTTEVTVDQSAPGTYFCAIGWNKGYFGIQEQEKGRKVVIFSVWDSQDDDKTALDPSRRVKLLHQDPQVRIGRFGGEGSGGQSFLDHDWKRGETYRFLVTSQVDGDRTAYSGYFYIPEDHAWKHLVTFSTITGGAEMSGYYSFIEDFQRDKVSTKHARTAHFGDAWVHLKTGGWQSIRRARFTADSNPALTINARIDDDRFLLATGGSTANTDAKLKETMILGTPKQPVDPPADLPR